MSKPKPARNVLVGREVTIVAFASSQGTSGLVIDETRNTIKLRTANKDKIFPKKEITIKVDDEIIQGEQLTGRIEERIKK